MWSMISAALRSLSNSFSREASSMGTAMSSMKEISARSMGLSGASGFAVRPSPLVVSRTWMPSAARAAW
eukprot:1926339-Alexandrium_andersonii.AAC.1